ncbi:MAG: assimilatory sulfite reductase (NADPH) flavoprotein subunit [Steroidobacteraceae bacterium]
MSSDAASRILEQAGIDPWGTAPFTRREVEELRALVAKLGPAQRFWLSGYLAGTAQRAGAEAVPPPAAAADPVTILVGSHSGNGEKLAKQLAERLAARQVPYRLLDMMDCRKADLEKINTLFVIISTHGDGDPPERAVPLHELLHGRRAPKLDHMRFAVLALGDSSYEKFCETGRQFDERLAALGAKRLQQRVECDVDYEAAASGWMDAVLASGVAAEQTTAVAASARPAETPAHVYTRKHPFPAEVLANQALTARGSTKDVRHIELSLADSGIHYEPGDALGLVLCNPADQVDALLQTPGLDADATVTVSGTQTSLRDALATHLEIGPLTTALVKRYAEATNDAELKKISGDEAALARFAYGRDLLDLVRAHPPRGLDTAGFAQLLRPATPRLYSIASSNRVTPDEVHLTVGVVAFESQGRARKGIISGQLAGIEPGSQLPVYVHRNGAFRLPANPETPVVMIGAGTGIAPYRAFLAEREEMGATGRNWLFFGDRSFEYDFLYQAELLAWRKNHLLTHIDVAFSRDQAQKVYVQQRLREQGAGLWAWLQEGANVYVCGDASGMAPEVEQALRDVIQQHGNLDADGAGEYLLDLQRARRYQKDVY